MAQDPAFWRLLLGLALLCAASGVAGLLRPEREPLQMDWALVLGGAAVALRAIAWLAGWQGGARRMALAAAALLAVASMVCLVRSRWWRRPVP